MLRNLSWRADGGSKASLRDVGAVSILMQAALSARKESTLKVILSAVWNLSAHCSINKVGSLLSGKFAVRVLACKLLLIAAHEIDYIDKNDIACGGTKAKIKITP